MTITYLRAAFIKFKLNVTSNSMNGTTLNAPTANEYTALKHNESVFASTEFLMGRSYHSDYSYPIIGKLPASNRMDSKPFKSIFP